jgi:hypothetical protein
MHRGFTGDRLRRVSSVPVRPAKVASPKETGRSALIKPTALHAPEPTFAVAGVNRRAGGEPSIHIRPSLVTISS